MAQGVSELDIEYSVNIATQYDGADTVLQIPFSPSLKAEFVAAHLRETSFSMQRPVRVSNIRIRGVGKSFKLAPADYAKDLASAESLAGATVVKSASYTQAFFELDGQVTGMTTPVYILGDVPIGSKIAGPAIIVDSTQTIVVEPNARAICLKEHVILRIDTQSRSFDKNGELSTDPIMLAVFANRFMSIAEQMGHTLQRTSISVSIKERLDFSCSIHGTDGALVANAPHIPVHLGSMQYAVQAQHNHWLGKLRPGDVLLTNHPQWGGKTLN
jgi:5-oxoprolinase (ATP-hydrolysing)